MERCPRQAMRSLWGPLTRMAYGGTAQNHTVPGSVSWPLPFWPPELLPTLCCTVWNLFVFWRWDHSLVCVCSHRVPKCVAMTCTCIYLSMYFRPNSVNFFFLNWSMTFWVWTIRDIKKSFQARFQSSFYNTVVYLLQSHNMVNKHSMQ